jgi:CheY-like chemotaxis protein
MTEFALELVLAQGKEPARHQQTPTPVSRALAVEDEHYNRVALGHVLMQLGFAVDWAATGAEALRLACSQHYDLILTDWRLPDTDGAALCRELARVMPKPMPPIVAVTAYSTREKLNEAKALGMAGFVTKPVTRESLEQVIGGLTRSLSPRRSLDTQRQRTPQRAVQPLQFLGDLAPNSQQLCQDLTDAWQRARTLAHLRDPRAGSQAHKVLGLLRFAADDAATEQVQLLEAACNRQDWETADQLLEFVDEVIETTVARLGGEPTSA